MTLTLASITEMAEAKQHVDEMQVTYPDLFARMVHVTNLTRALGLKYHYMGSLIMNEAVDLKPALHSSVLQLYLDEIQSLTSHHDIDNIRSLFAGHRFCGYAKISLLFLGRTPESIAGASSVQ